MVNRNFSEDDVTGFSYYRGSRSQGILLPIPVAEALKADAAAMADFKAEEKKVFTTKTETSRVPVRGGKPLPKIRINTNRDIGDAMAYARKRLAGVVPPALLPAQFSQDLLVAVLMTTAYGQPTRGMSDVLYYLVDPGWDCAKQVLTELKNSGKAFSQQSAATWFEKFDSNQIDPLLQGEDRTAADLLKAANLHWTKALDQPKRQTRKTVEAVEVEKPNHTIQVFCPQALEQAVVALGDMNRDRQSAGARILEQARADHGERTLPDAQQASKNLETKILDFENLRKPIERLQLDLVLAAAMRAQEFRISPILLLGAPGIGKTYLASQLADALGVPMEKISAGGSQGGFQLTGSHGAWMGAKPGMIAAMLAKSTSAAPVLVIDEVDKIQDGRYPFLPVLLDLLDAGTAKHFRDEYFEMEFDASRIIVVLTANDIDKVPPPLLSRVEDFTILAPQPAQRLRIIEQTMDHLCEKTGQQIGLGLGVAERLAERMTIDLRQLNSLIRAAFATALQTGDKVARIQGGSVVQWNGKQL